MKLRKTPTWKSGKCQKCGKVCASGAAMRTNRCVQCRAEPFAAELTVAAAAVLRAFHEHRALAMAMSDVSIVLKKIGFGCCVEAR